MNIPAIFYEWAFELMHWHQACIELGNENQCEHSSKDVEVARAFISDFIYRLNKEATNVKTD